MSMNSSNKVRLGFVARTALDGERHVKNNWRGLLSGFHAKRYLAYLLLPIGCSLRILNSRTAIRPAVDPPSTGSRLSRESRTDTPQRAQHPLGSYMGGYGRLRVPWACANGGRLASRSSGILAGPTPVAGGHDNFLFACTDHAAPRFANRPQQISPGTRVAAVRDPAAHQRCRRRSSATKPEAFRDHCPVEFHGSSTGTQHLQARRLERGSQHRSQFLGYTAFLHEKVNHDHGATVPRSG